ncbi:nuclear transport factor 2 family protein [Thermomonospora cellulosilytica]|uniref:Ketosteroid isomerase-like protein n=1 Tax=Thermomonospora cellulosilytica TaxID=1411118 RepID=A0A7W3MUT9_9ACTN|nr:nuclear transport factor 2 family protein [Thermomonospora cellulosilytica]MBA9002306.1 ketosteroid isomerase-like protein [Thermomonospora cellulosilytica]
MSTEETVAELLARIGAGDPERIAEMFAEPVEWGLSWPDEGHPAVPWIRPREKRADVADHFRSLDAFHVRERNGTTVDRILVDGADAVVLGRIVQVVKATGREYESPFALHLTVENGLISRYHIYEDSLTVANALGG